MMIMMKKQFCVCLLQDEEDGSREFTEHFDIVALKVYVYVGL